MKRLLLLAALAALSATQGCQVRSVLLVDQADGSTASRTGTGNTDGGFGFGLGGSSGGQAGSSGTAGQSGGADGGGVSGDGVPSNCVRTVELCNGLDDDCDGVIDNGFDLQTDNGNCGACGTVCNFPHSFPLCRVGVCGIEDCLPGYVDVDKKQDNGCECLRTNGGVELCDGADNDCDGLVDEDFQLQSDLNNCGACGTVCDFANATATCAAGKCTMGACRAGRIDLNRDTKDGCEYSCAPTKNGIEICDGVDNDCNGGIDDNAVDANKPCGQVTSGVGECRPGMNICTSGQLVCLGANQPSPEICDGKDNNCDGATDEGFDKLNDIRYCGTCRPCALAHGVPRCAAGVCELETCSPGYIDLNGEKADGCEYSCTFRGVEICNGVDDDCDGMIDEGIDKATDAANCGACGNVCRYANAAPVCSRGTCGMGTCDDNFYDLDGKPTNGCEYFCVASGVEICDGIDNDCNGKIDEGIDTKSDANNCGACGRTCQFTNAAGRCQAGTCVIGGCTADHYNINNNPADGCEYGCAPSNGGAEICDNKDNNCNAQVDETDPQVGKNCFPEDVVGCNVAAGTCKGICAFGKYACRGGSLACDGPTIPRTDVCDDIDNDCDGAVDQDFDKVNDPRFCGGCNATCAFANAIALCTSRMCTRGPCKTGFVDLDGSPANGCEYVCTPDGPEVCDGKDNDCNGQIDATDTGLLYPTTNFCSQIGECGKGPGGSTKYPGQASFPVCTTPPGGTQPDWVCNYPGGVQTTGTNQLTGQESWCDGLDNDCDGAVDEHIAAGTLGASCFDVAGVGECRRTGTMRCQADKTAVAACDFTGVPAKVAEHEVCDGKDNDCDGLVDESWDNPTGLGLTKCSAGADDCRGVRDDMVHVTVAATPYYIYQHEASRTDATASNGGANAIRACGRGSVLPWTSVTYTQAQAACGAAGLRLCRTIRTGGCGQGAITKDEWGLACQNGLTCGVSYYPYACTYDAAKCNGAEKNIGAAAATGSSMQCLTSGDLDTVTSGNQQLLDMSGNVTEWTDDCRGTLSDGRNIYTLRGGAYDSFDIGMRCEFMVAQLAANFSHPDTGFRCCSSCAPGLAECSGTCVNFSSDNNHCGACTTACSSATTCKNGICR